MATVSERHAPPTHASCVLARLGGACLSETVSTIVKNHLVLNKHKNYKKNDFFPPFLEVRVLHIYISLNIWTFIHIVYSLYMKYLQGSWKYDSYTISKIVFSSALAVIIFVFMKCE